MTKSLKVVTKKVADLTPDPDNARMRGPRAVEAIASSLQRFGQQKPIVCTTAGVVIAGNGTLAAAKKLGWETISVQVTDLEGLEAQAFAVADNRTAELAYWSEDRLGAVLSKLSDNDDPDLANATGFNEAEMRALAKAIAEHEDDDEAGAAAPSGGGASDNLAEEVEEPEHVCPKCGYRF